MIPGPALPFVGIPLAPLDAADLMNHQIVQPSLDEVRLHIGMPLSEFLREEDRRIVGIGRPGRSA